MFHKYFCLVFILFIISFNGHAQKTNKNKIVNLITLSDYSPFCFLKEKVDKKYNNNFTEIIKTNKDSIYLQGYSWDIVKNALFQLGYTIHLTVVPWSRGMGLLDSTNKDYLIFPAGVNSERILKYSYAKNSVANTNFVIYVRKKFKKKWEGIKSLYPLRVSSMKDWNYGDKWKQAKANGLNPVPIYKISIGLRQLKENVIDALAGYDISFDDVIKKEGLQNSFKKWGYIGHTQEFLIGQKSNKRIFQILKDFDKGFEIIQNNNILSEIKKKWTLDN